MLRLNDPRASSLHAVLSWTGKDWELRDLGSRNGTFVNGRRLESGQRELLAHDDKLGFGGQSEIWTLIGDGQPTLGAVSAAGQWVQADSELLALPSAEAPEVVVYAGEQGGWLMERDLEVGPVPSNNTVEAGGQIWTLELPLLQTPTAAATSTEALLSFSEVKLVFKVSLDEENVCIDLHCQGQLRQIPHRAQNYLLLTLARARQGEGDLEPSERGWCYRDDLIRGLRIPENQFNVAVFRARQHLKRAGIVGAKDLVERRRGSTQLRLGTECFEIVRL